MIQITPKFLSWPHQLLSSHQLRLEYGDNQVVVRHISKDESMFFYKAYRDVFDLSMLERYGFSKELYGKNIAEHKRVSKTKYAFLETRYKPTLREIVFVLKDGRKIAFESAIFAPGQLHGLVTYIEENNGIRPTGTLAVSLLTTKFTDEKIKYIYDMISFPENKLQNVELKISEIYFTKEAVVIYKSGQVAHIPCDKLQAICFYAKTAMTKGIIIAHTGLSCCFWLKNGQQYYCMVDSVEDFEKIAAYIHRNHPGIEANPELVYEGIVF